MKDKFRENFKIAPAGGARSLVIILVLSRSAPTSAAASMHRPTLIRLVPYYSSCSSAASIGVNVFVPSCCRKPPWGSIIAIGHGRHRRRSAGQHWRQRRRQACFRNRCALGVVSRSATYGGFGGACWRRLLAARG